MNIHRTRQKRKTQKHKLAEPIIVIRHLCSQPKINIAKTSHHASAAVHQLFKGLFCSKLLFTTLLCSLKWSLPCTWLQDGAYFTRQTWTNGVCGGCAAFLIPGQRQVRRPASCSSFECYSSFPDGYHGPGHPLVHEVSAASATSYRTDSQGQGEAMLLELLAELVLALLCQSSCWVANKEKILRSSPMWPQFSVSCVHLKLTFKFWGNAPLCGSLSVWGDFADYKFS